MKSQVLAAIGETYLKHPAQVNAALAANDRLKYYFSLLQMAMARRGRTCVGLAQNDVPLAGSCRGKLVGSESSGLAAAGGNLLPLRPVLSN